MPTLFVAEVSLDQIGVDETTREAKPSLIQCLREHGLLEPVDLRAREAGGYELLEGSRRLDAARQLGWKTITAIVEPADAAGLSKELRAILIDAHREKLRHLHLARRCARLMKEMGWSQAEVARRTGKSKQSVSEMLGVLSCPDLVAAMDGEALEFGAARALTALLPEQRRQILAELRERAAAEGKFPPVRQVEERVRRRQGHAPLPEVLPEQLERVREALEARGFPVEVKVVWSKRPGMQITVQLTEPEAGRLGEELARREGPGRRAA